MKIQGKNAVSEAIKSGTTIDVVFAEKGTAHPIIAMCREKGIKLKFVDKYYLDKESFDGKHQGFIAHISEFEYSEVEDILAVAEERQEPHFIVILDGILDPHNLGSILRVCECAGVHGVIIGKDRAVPVNETVIKTSAGATSYMKVARVVNINRVIKELQQKNIWVYCADMDGEDLFKSDLRGNLALVIGGEGNGVGKLIKDSCDKVVSIGLHGKVDSLNASVACGVVVYEALRQRKL
ncbi:MAG: 23S rRNA (guanosine(2251)-2'-O)-methyltransferase RlmB [Clostridia bacterium]|nr:23S rRNA (guanosine(2251)-2'-O)-methyltransferase RlmB [Clostridia bacterium]